MAELTRVVTHGIGRVEVIPDTATVGLGAFTRGDQAGVAVRDNAATVEALVEVLNTVGIPTTDRQTTALQVQPEWDHQRQPPTITGYWASQEIRVRLRDVGLVSELIDTTGTALGDALRISGVTFGVANPTPHVSAARMRAVHIALAQAKELAEAAGTELGRLHSIEEAEHSGVFAPAGGLALAAGGGGPRVEPGTVVFSVQVTVTYEIADSRAVPAT